MNLRVTEMVVASASDAHGFRNPVLQLTRGFFFPYAFLLLTDKYVINHKLV